MPKPDVSLFDLTERVSQVVVDALFALWPRSKPGEAALRRCRIISHRGEHDNVTVFENTLPAFDIARDHGVWGSECDSRWTKDLVPVVYHDADLRRLFGDSLMIGQTRFHRLRKSFPQIPSLSEVLTRYGKTLHLMVEMGRQAGVGLHFRSLPTRPGLGDIAAAACSFVDFLAESGIAVWQYLPTG